MKQIYQRLPKFSNRNAFHSLAILTMSLTMYGLTVSAQPSAKAVSQEPETMVAQTNTAAPVETPTTIRLVQKKKYKVIDATGFPIYTHQDYVNVAKGSMISKTFYSFSRDTNSEVMPLTRANLKKAFPDKTEFHYTLDAGFKNDQQLTAWDKYQKMYKVKYLFLKN